MKIESTEIEGIYRHTIDYVLRSVKRMQERGDPGNIDAALIEINCKDAIEAASRASKVKLNKKDKKKRTLLEAIKLARGGDAPIQKQCI